jgi:hypothetical protein
MAIYPAPWFSLGFAVGMVAMYYLKPIHDANVKELRIEAVKSNGDKQREEFNRDMLRLTQERHLAKEHNRLILSQYWRDKCEADQTNKIQICIDGPPKVVP